MITNTDLTVYHKTLNEETRLEQWERYFYKNVWLFAGKNSTQSDGYQVSNSAEIRIPYNSNENADISHFSVGDILYKGNVQKQITSQSDVSEAYTIVSVNNNTFGNEQHIHIGAR